MSISSKRDLALGYSFATLQAIGIHLVQMERMRKGEDTTSQDILDVRGMVEKRLHEIVDEIEIELETES